MSETILGIDLGTTNSLAGAVLDGAVKLFAGTSGNELLPSVVGVGSGERSSSEGRPRTGACSIRKARSCRSSA